MKIVALSIVVGIFTASGCGEETTFYDGSFSARSATEDQESAPVRNSGETLHAPDDSAPTPDGDEATSNSKLEGIEDSLDEVVNKLGCDITNIDPVTGIERFYREFAYVDQKPADQADAEEICGGLAATKGGNWRHARMDSSCNLIFMLDAMLKANVEPTLANSPTIFTKCNEIVAMEWGAYAEVQPNCSANRIMINWPGKIENCDNQGASEACIFEDTFESSGLPFYNLLCEKY